MGHMVESIVWNQKGPPWHGLGKSVYGKKLGPEEICREVGTDWTVHYFPSYIILPTKDEEGNQNKIIHELNRGALVRSSDFRILSDNIPSDWDIRQNIDAARFFCEYVEAGKMEMDTAGSLCEGELVWFLAKIVDDGFDLFGGRDHIDPYLLFVNPHRYGMSSSVSFTPIQVVCWNTMRMSLAKSKGTDRIVKITHRKEFIAEEVKETLGISRQKMKEYKRMAEYLISHKATDEKIRDYIRDLFPIHSSDPEKKKELSLSAKKCIGLVNTQPGADLAPGTWWAAYNSVTHFADHVASKSPDTRLTSAWFGEMRNIKSNALDLALQFAGLSPTV